MNGKRRAELRTYIEGELEHVSSVSVPEFTRETVEHFMEHNNGFVEEFLHESLLPIVEQMVRTAMRKHKPGDALEVYSLGDEVVTEEELGRQAENLSSRFSRWLEHAGDRHYAFKQMTKPKLFVAAEERSKRGRTELFIAGYMRVIADPLEEGETVEEHYSDEELEAIWQEMLGNTRGEEAV